MFRKIEKQLCLEDFILPFGGRLRVDNRWVKLAKIIPWDTIEDRYADLFPSYRGQVAKPVRMALGALIIQEKCKFSDRETVEHITENHFMQFFIGLREYQDQPPFDPSLMVHFRKRFNAETLKAINEEICRVTKGEEEKKDDDDGKPKPPSDGNKAITEEAANPESKTSPFKIYQANQGKLILDATCAPADIHYPTDLSLLNEAREKLDEIIDTVHKALGKPGRRPRTYRQIARKAYLRIVRDRKPGKKAVRKAIGKQLRYVKRNLLAVDRLLKMAGDGHGLSQKHLDKLDTIRKLYEQQRYMHTNRTHKTNDRIVSISQPHVRPIVRGKVTADVEFGAKVAISIVNGYAYVERLSWDAFNEGNTLIKSVEGYRQRYGAYPEVVQADKIYRNRENLQYCENHGIRLSGPRLGRPPADKEHRRDQKRLERQDASERNAIEGKFGEAKRRYGLARIMARLKETAESVIYLQFLVMNLERRLRVLFFNFLRHLFRDDLVKFKLSIWCFSGN